MNKTMSVLVAGLAMMANSFAAASSDYPSACNCDGENARFACMVNHKPNQKNRKRLFQLNPSHAHPGDGHRQEVREG